MLQPFTCGFGSGFKFLILRGFLRDVPIADWTGVGYGSFDGAQESIGDLCNGRIGGWGGFGFGGPDAEDQPDGGDWEPAQARGFPDCDGGDGCEWGEAGEEPTGAQISVMGDDDSGELEECCVKEWDQGGRSDEGVVFWGPAGLANSLKCGIGNWNWKWRELDWRGILRFGHSFHSEPCASGR